MQHTDRADPEGMGDGSHAPPRPGAGRVSNRRSRQVDHAGAGVMAEEERLRRCDGWVASLDGQMVAYTGQVLVDGALVPQATCARLAARQGADWRDDWSSTVTLLVQGDLAGKQVIDPQRRYSRKLVAAQQARRQGIHVHVVDADGFSDLLVGEAARCRRLRRHAGRIVLAPTPGDGILGPPLKPRRAPRRTSSGLLWRDWDQGGGRCRHRRPRADHQGADRPPRPRRRRGPGTLAWCTPVRRRVDSWPTCVCR